MIKLSEKTLFYIPRCEIALRKIEKCQLMDTPQRESFYVFMLFCKTESGKAGGSKNNKSWFYECLADNTAGENHIDAICDLNSVLSVNFAFVPLTIIDCSGCFAI